MGTLLDMAKDPKWLRAKEIIKRAQNNYYASELRKYLEQHEQQDKQMGESVRQGWQSSEESPSEERDNSRVRRNAR